MSLFLGSVLIIVSGTLIFSGKSKDGKYSEEEEIKINQEEVKKREEEVKKRQEEFEERMKIMMESSKKIVEKRRFILDLIDEIPELSYYEAAQLKKKVSIYLMWNDE